jgi:DNA repair protein RadD
VIPEQRAYQTEAVRKLPALLRKHGRVVAVSPTASGKTVIGVMLIVEKYRRKRVLWLAHRIELIKQAHDRLAKDGVPAKDLGVLSGPLKRNEGARVLVASIDTVRARDMAGFDLIVVDECHRIEAKSYQTVLDSMPDTPVLGLTATPWRLDGKPLGDTFRHMLVVAGQTELIADGYLMRPISYGVPREKARAMVAGISSNGDYAVKALGQAMKKNRLMGDVVSECARLAPGEKTLVFAVNRDHGKALAARFKKSKRPTAYLDGETPAVVRALMIEALKSGALEVIVNVDVLTEGFDAPPVKCVVMARPTKSLTRFLQYVGRAARPYKRKRPIIIDHAGNRWRHGLPEQEREWSLEGYPTLVASDSPARICPACMAMIHTSATVCPECGAELPKTVKEIRETKATLERLTASNTQREMIREQLLRLAKKHRQPESWVTSALEQAVGV